MNSASGSGWGGGGVQEFLFIASAGALRMGGLGKC